MMCSNETSFIFTDKYSSRTTGLLPLSKTGWRMLKIIKIPSTIPPLNEATKRLVERANAEAKK